MAWRSGARSRGVRVRVCAHMHWSPPMVWTATATCSLSTWPSPVLLRWLARGAMRAWRPPTQDPYASTMHQRCRSVHRVITLCCRAFGMVPSGWRHVGLGGARAVAARLYRAVAEQDGGASANPHAQAHLGAVEAVLAATEAMLSSAAEFVDTEPSSGRTGLIARRVRAVAETAVDEAITRTGRALGPAPLALDADHARRVADLSMYVRQSHAEQDLAALGRLACR